MQDNTHLFNNLFVFDMANNHMGDVDHGLRIIQELGRVVRQFDFTCALKFQYRDLDTFIHPAYKSNFNFKYVKRFQQTRLSDADLLSLKQAADEQGFISMCTPFDEPSVDKIVDYGFDIVKVASCSFTDWPLLERIVQTDKPIVASTAGAGLADIDRVVLFLKHRRKQFAIMHCVGEYPTRTEHLDLNQIDFFIQRYPDAVIGYSTHEAPDNLDAVKIAMAKGARLFERHVGLETDTYALNAYSSTPDQVSAWMQSAKEAMTMCGVAGDRRPIYDKERTDLEGLMRGAFAKADIPSGQKISTADLFFAIPKLDGQVAANHISKYTDFIARTPIKAGAPILFDAVATEDIRDHVLRTISQVREMLVDSKVHLPHMLQFELSHHYGIERLDECGAVIINCVNRDYCKKLIIMLPGQQHPAHYHKRKEETFQILSGELILDLGSGEKAYGPGDLILVERGVKHSFRSEGGCIFEEVSGTHYTDDSYYDDPEILKNINRKTEMTFWMDWLYDEKLG
ncbi:MAG: N-acetylneuraminate synthase family protein [Desulfatitalea sp.]|nr:N-acetylneuraminate synthase family protein [Desulfatitalea sp.]